jgi:hypothetical protein
MRMTGPFGAGLVRVIDVLTGRTAELPDALAGGSWTA